ncbi:IclR family transcriptional regulator [Roseomonas sp. 18066]|uniref:IclR family transcriptional regulator n=1 Tax=Roseomonas sp. 18066 TaxID=2681412 RepID=UPI0013573C33|nr:helix-turn-helix domain-containing protein [Roseomonas sp. 18066]
MDNLPSLQGIDANPPAPAAAGPAESGIQVLDRAIGLLQALGQTGNNGLQLSRLAAQQGLSLSTTHRLLTALERHGWVERVAGSKRLRLGLALLGLSGQAADGSGLRRLCRPALLQLSGEFGETFYLIVRSGLNALVVDRQEGAYVIESLTQGIGGMMPLGIGAGSAAILAAQPQAEIEAVLGANAARYPQFGTSLEQVRRRVQQVQQDGHLLSDDSLISGLAVLSVPIRPRGHVVTAALATNFIASRHDAAGRQAFLDRIRQEAATIEAGLTASATAHARFNPGHGAASDR